MTEYLGGLIIGAAVTLFLLAATVGYWADDVARWVA